MFQFLTTWPLDVRVSVIVGAVWRWRTSGDLTRAHLRERIELGKPQRCGCSHQEQPRLRIPAIKTLVLKVRLDKVSEVEYKWGQNLS